MADRDYKHVVQDTTNVYIGGKLSYGEMLDIDEIPFKFKSLLSRYILRDVAPDTTIENHIFYMTKQDESYLVYNRIKAKFGLYVFDDKKRSYVKREYKIDEIVGNEELFAKKDTTFVEELHIYKLNLLSMS